MVKALSSSHPPPSKERHPPIDPSPAVRSYSDGAWLSHTTLTVLSPQRVTARGGLFSRRVFSSDVESSFPVVSDRILLQRLRGFAWVQWFLVFLSSFLTFVMCPREGSVCVAFFCCLIAADLLWQLGFVFLVVFQCNLPLVGISLGSSCCLVNKSAR